MARFFLSRAYADQELAREIERRLRDAGHEVSIPVGTLPAGKWRDKLWRALESSDVHMALLSENGLGSPYVASEIGAAGVVDRARGMLVLPILFRDSGDIPLFVSDYACFRLASKEKVSLDALVGELCKAIEQHSVATLGGPKIFVSHRHKDEPQAAHSWNCYKRPLKSRRKTFDVHRFRHTNSTQAIRRPSDCGQKSQAQKSF